MSQDDKSQATMPKIDAGLQSLNHYQHRLPKWRFELRERVIPVVRWETPYLACLQDRFRTPGLDSYFAFSANLGTHIFFMAFLPVLFWCGFTTLGRALVHVLAGGVYTSGFIKDMLCLPRPLSPPVQRISRSDSAALEYGFPSTHSTNAVSVAMYAIYAVRTSPEMYSPTAALIAQAILCFYASSIVVGRIYCGMHGYLDVVVGVLLGAAIAGMQIYYGGAFDSWFLGGSAQQMAMFVLLDLILVRIHPEPADDCPCYDDSVAFIGTVIGVNVGNWHYTRTKFSWTDPVQGTVPFSLQELGFIKASLRIVLGIVLVFSWRAVMKPTLLRTLPPIFRFIEKLGMLLPRKFFLPASQYDRVPPLRKDDNVIPPASEIPAMINSLRFPRKRAVSIGPQSQADVYETIALRERKRRQSSTGSWDADVKSALAKRPSGDPLDRAAAEIVLGNKELDEQQDREMFSKLFVPRVRYDVEVVTKLIVYAGIGMIAAEGAPIAFELIGLGLGVR